MRGYGTLENVQSWWEVPCIAHFCSLFRLYFELLDFDIEELEEALITDGVEDSAGSSLLLQDLIVRLLRGCFNSHKNEITSSNYQMYLRRLFRIKCEEDPTKNNPFDGDLAFHSLPLRTKVEILRDLCDFRLDNDDVPESLKTLEAESLRVVPLGQDSGGSTYWYFYGTRLYREDYSTPNNSAQPVKKRGRKKNLPQQQQIVAKWQVSCFTEQDWQILAARFKNCKSPHERGLFRTLRDDFLPELPRLFAEKEKLLRKRMLEQQLRRNGKSVVVDENNSVSSISASISSLGLSNGFLTNGTGKRSRIRNSSTLSLPLNPNLLNNNNDKVKNSGEKYRSVSRNHSESGKRAHWGYDDENSWSPNEDDDDNNNRKISTMDLDDEHSGRECSSPPDEEEVRRRREEQERADRLLAEAIEREERKARLHLRERRGCGGGTFSSPSNAGSRNSSSVSTERTTQSIKASTVSKQTVAAAVSKKNSKASPVKASPVKSKKAKSKSKSKSGKGHNEKKGGRMTNNSLSVSLSPIADDGELTPLEEDIDSSKGPHETDRARAGKIPSGFREEDEEFDREKVDILRQFESACYKNFKAEKDSCRRDSTCRREMTGDRINSHRSHSPTEPPPKKKTKKSQNKASAKKKMRNRAKDDDNVGEDTFEEENFEADEDHQDEFCEEEEEPDYESIVARTLHNNNNNHKKSGTKGKNGKEKGGSNSKTKSKSSKEKKRSSAEGSTERSRSKSKDKGSSSKKNKKSSEKATASSSKSGGSKFKSPPKPCTSMGSLIGASTISLGGGTSKTKVKSSVIFSQSEEDVQIGMHKVIEAIKNHRDAWPFINPVDEDYAPNYYRVVDHPMDLQTMEDKLDNQEYSSLDEFRGDFDRIVDNCRKYNGPGSEYTEMVEIIEKSFNKLIQRYITPDESDEEISIEYTNATSSSDRLKRSMNHHSSSPSKKKAKESTKSSGRSSSSPTAVASKSKSAKEKDHKKENEPARASSKKKSKSAASTVVADSETRGRSASRSPSKSSPVASSKELKEKEKQERKKKKAQLMRHHSRDSEAIENLSSVAAETLKDINKWLDDTPKPVEKDYGGSSSSSETNAVKSSKGEGKGYAGTSAVGGIKEKKKKLLTSSGTGQKRKLAELSSKKVRSTQFIMDEDDEYNIDRDLSPPPAKITKTEKDGDNKSGKQSKKKGNKGADGGKEKKEGKGGKKDKHHHHHHKKHHHHHHHHHKRESTSADDSTKSVSKSSSKTKSKVGEIKKSISSSSSSISSMSTTASSSLSQQQKVQQRGKGGKKKGDGETGKKGKGGKKSAAGGNSGSLMNTLKNSPAFKRMNQMSRVNKALNSSSSSDSSKGLSTSGNKGEPQSNSIVSGATSQGPGSAFDALLSNLNNASGMSGNNGGSDGASSSNGTAAAEKKKCLLVSDLPADKEGKLSLGSVLSTDAIKLGNFKENEEGLSDDEDIGLSNINNVKTEEEKQKLQVEKEEKDAVGGASSAAAMSKLDVEQEQEEEKEEDYEVNRKLEPSKGFNRERCMPNLSAWIKAFGGPAKTGSGGNSTANSVSASSPLTSPVKKADPETKNKFRVMGRGVGESEGGRSHSHTVHSSKSSISHPPPPPPVSHHPSVIKTTSLPSPTGLGQSNVGASWNPVTSLPRPSPPSNPILNPTKPSGLERNNGSSNKVENLSSSPTASSQNQHHHSSKKHRNRKMSSSSLSSQSESGSPLCVTHEGSSGSFLSGSAGGSVVNPPRWVEDHPWGPVSQSQSPSASSHVSSQSPAGPNSPFSPSVNSPPPSTPQTPPRPPAPVRVGFYQDITASQHSSPDKVNESQSSPATPPTPSSLHGGGNSRGSGGTNNTSANTTASARRGARGTSGAVDSGYIPNVYAPRYVSSTPSPNVVAAGPGSSQSLPSPATPPSSGSMNNPNSPLSNPNSPNSSKVVVNKHQHHSSSSSSSSGAADYRSHSNSGSGAGGSSGSITMNGPQSQHSSRPPSVLHGVPSPYSTPPAHHFTSMDQHIRNSAGGGGSSSSHQLPDPAHSHHGHQVSSSPHHQQTPAHAHSNQTSHVHSLSHLGQPQQAHAGSNHQYHDSSSSRYPPNLPHAHQQSSVATTPPSTSSSYSGGSGGSSGHQNLAQAHAHSRQSTSQTHLSHPYPSNPYASNPRNINVAPNVYNNPISSDPSMNRYYKAAMAAVASASGNSSGGSELTLSMGPSTGGSSSQSSSSTSGSSSKRHSRSNASANATPSPHSDIPRSASVNPTAAAAVAAALEAGKIAPSDLANGFHWPHNLASLTQIVNSIPSAYRHYADPESMSKYQRAAAAAAAAAAAQQESSGYPVTTSAGSGGTPSSTPTSGSGKSHHHHHHQSDKSDSMPTHHHHLHHHTESSHASGGSSGSSSSSNKKQSKSSSGSSEAKSRSQSSASAKSSSAAGASGIVPGSAFNFSSLAPDSLALYSKEMSDASSLYSASPPTLTPPMAHRASDFYPTASSASHFPHHSSFSAAAAARTTTGGVPTPPITPYPFLPGSHTSPYQAHQPVSSQPFAAHSQSSRGLDPYQQLFQGSPHVMGLLSHPSGYPAPYAHPHSSLGFNRPGWI